MIRFGNFAIATLLCCTAAAAQDNGYWKPVSKTASAITGEIGISGEKLSINFAIFTIADLRPLTGDESLALFNIDADAKGAGKLYRLDIPAGKTFLHRNTMCGTEDTQYMATYASGKSCRSPSFPDRRCQSSRRMPLRTQRHCAAPFPTGDDGGMAQSRREHL